MNLAPQYSIHNRPFEQRLISLRYSFDADLPDVVIPLISLHRNSESVQIIQFYEALGYTAQISINERELTMADLQPTFSAAVVDRKGERIL